MYIENFLHKKNDKVFYTRTQSMRQNKNFIPPKRSFLVRIEFILTEKLKFTPPKQIPIRKQTKTKTLVLSKHLNSICVDFTWSTISEMSKQWKVRNSGFALLHSFHSRRINKPTDFQDICIIHIYFCSIFYLHSSDDAEKLVKCSKNISPFGAFLFHPSRIKFVHKSTFHSRPF